MKTLVSLLMAVLASWSFFGCDEGDDADDDTASDADGDTDGDADSDSDSETSSEPVCDNLITDGVIDVREEYDYSFQSSLEIEAYPLKELCNPVFDWSGVTTDLTGRALDPLNDVDTVEIIVFKLTEQELEQKINDDSLMQSDMEALVFLYTENAMTSAEMSEFELFGYDIDPETYFDATTYPPDQFSFLFILATGQELGTGARLIAIVRPDPNATATELKVTSDATTLSYTVDLLSLKKYQVPVATPQLTMDWSNIETNAMGKPFELSQVHQIMLDHFSTMTVEELEDDFLNLEYIADQTYTMDIESGITADLSLLKDGDGNAFAGIDAIGTWILAIRCTVNCQNPAPKFLTVIQACP